MSSSAPVTLLAHESGSDGAARRGRPAEPTSSDSCPGTPCVISVWWIHSSTRSGGPPGEAGKRTISGLRVALTQELSGTLRFPRIRCPNLGPGTLKFVMNQPHPPVIDSITQTHTHTHTSALPNAASATQTSPTYPDRAG